jgi:hypothetical protein
MPLDGADLFENPTLAKLWEVERMLATEEHWCKGRLHDRRGRHCLVGAITEVNARQELTRPIIRAIKEISGKHYWRIESFNDDPNTSHQDILRVLHRARLILIADLARAEEPRPWYRKLIEIVDEILPLAQKETADCRADPAPLPVPIRTDELVRSERRVASASRTPETCDLLQ